MLIVVVDKGVDLAFEITDGLEGTAADRLVGNQGEPALDLVEPRTVGWGEVQMETGASRQPRANPWMLMGGVVVADQMHIETGRYVGFNVAQEGQEFLMPMLGFALRQHAAVGNIQRCKQRRGSVANIIMRDARYVADAQRHYR